MLWLILCNTSESVLVSSCEESNEWLQHTGRKTVQMYFCLSSPSSPSGTESVALTYLLSAGCNYSAYQFSIKIQM